MAVGMFLQSIASVLRAVFFFCIAIVKPLDLLADLLQRFALWLSIDKDMMQMMLKHKDGKNE
jgi:hypothetical protein